MSQAWSSTLVGVARSAAAVSAVATAGEPALRTTRKSICAACLTRSIVSCDGDPGMPTTIWFEPWLVISASATPEESMRWRMMLIA